MEYALYGLRESHKKGGRIKKKNSGKKWQDYKKALTADTALSEEGMGLRLSIKLRKQCVKQLLAF